MAATEAQMQDTDEQNLASRSMRRLMEYQEQRKRQSGEQSSGLIVESDGESLPSLDKIRFDDNIVQLKDPRKKRRKREANATRTGRRRLREEQQQQRQADPVPTSLSTRSDSLPSLNKITFDDHIVSITDPDPPEEKLERNQEVPSPEVKTAESFTLGDRSDELIISMPRMKSPRRSPESVPQRPREVVEDSSRTTKNLENIGTENAESKKSVLTKAGGNENSLAKKDATPAERNIPVGDRKLSSWETERLIRKLWHLKKDKMKSHRYSNYNRIESTRTSRAASPTRAKQPQLNGNEATRLDSNVPVSNVASKFTSPLVSTRTEKTSARINTAQPIVLRPNYNRIDSCRTSRASSPQYPSGKPKEKIRVGDRFVTIPEAIEVLQRMLKANSQRGRRSIQRAQAGVAQEGPTSVQSEPRRRFHRRVNDGSYPVYKVKIDNRVVPIPIMEDQRPIDDAEACNFTHLDTVIRTDDEVSSIMIAFCFGIIILVVLALIVARVTNRAMTIIM